ARWLPRPTSLICSWSLPTKLEAKRAGRVAFEPWPARLRNRWGVRSAAGRRRRSWPAARERQFQPVQPGLAKLHPTLSTAHERARGIPLTIAVHVLPPSTALV